MDALEYSAILSMFVIKLAGLPLLSLSITAHELPSKVSALNGLSTLLTRHVSSIEQITGE